MPHQQHKPPAPAVLTCFKNASACPRFSFLPILGSELCTIDLRGPNPTDEFLKARASCQIKLSSRNAPVQRTPTVPRTPLFANSGVRKEVERERGPSLGCLIEIESAGFAAPCGWQRPVPAPTAIGKCLLVRRPAPKFRRIGSGEFCLRRRAGTFFAGASFSPSLRRPRSRRN